MLIASNINIYIICKIAFIVFLILKYLIILNDAKIYGIIVILQRALISHALNIIHLSERR